MQAICPMQLAELSCASCPAPRGIGCWIAGQHGADHLRGQWQPQLLPPDFETLTGLRALTALRSDRTVCVHTAGKTGRPYIECFPILQPELTRHAVWLAKSKTGLPASHGAARPRNISAVLQFLESSPSGEACQVLLAHAAIGDDVHVVDGAVVLSHDVQRGERHQQVLQLAVAAAQAVHDVDGGSSAEVRGRERSMVGRAGDGADDEQSQQEESQDAEDQAGREFEDQAPRRSRHALDMDWIFGA